MIVVVMGVSGSGKSTVGRLLAERLRVPFVDADDFHSPQNIAKMARGTPLTDEDRAGWLETLAGLLSQKAEKGASVVLACSALKASHRSVLRVSSEVRFLYLKGDYDRILDRLNQRSGHFMRPELLKSQFEALEEPEDGIVIDIDRSVAEIVRDAEKKLLRG
jgi:carbohydrate kinase (thermoresistant glucokinase family)